MFKKRKENVLDRCGGYNPPNIPICKEFDDGMRQNCRVSPQEYRQLNPIDFVDFSLTEEMQAGVDIRQLPTSNMLDVNPEMSDEQILEKLQAQQEPEPQE